MVETTFNLFDAVVVLVVALSSLLSFFRGFVREVLSLGAWFGASLCALYLFPDVAAAIKPQLNNELAASGIAALGTFFTALIVISIFNSLLIRLFKRGKDVGMLDNWMGLVFGVLRAALLLSLGYYIMGFVMAQEDFPEWLQAAQTRPLVEKGAAVVAKLAPDYLETMSPVLGADGQEDGDAGAAFLGGNGGAQLQQLLEATQGEGGLQGLDAQGYPSGDANDLGRMLENLQKLQEMKEQQEQQQQNLPLIIDRTQPQP